MELRRTGQRYRMNALQWPAKVIRQLLPRVVRNRDQSVSTLQGQPELLLKVTGNLRRVAMSPGKGDRS